MTEQLINNVTLICIYCVDINRAIASIYLCKLKIPFKHIKLLTSFETDY